MTPGDWTPSHAYIPGQTPRHPEGAFDALKADLDSHGADQLHHSMAWAAGLRFLCCGLYWEAHEVLEAVWMACPPNSAEKCLVQGVIQLANARLKTVMGQPRAALRLEALALAHLSEAFVRGGTCVMGQDRAAVDEIRAMRILHYNA